VTGGSGGCAFAVDALEPSGNVITVSLPLVFPIETVIVPPFDIDCKPTEGFGVAAAAAKDACNIPCPELELEFEPEYELEPELDCTGPIYI